MPSLPTVTHTQDSGEVASGITVKADVQGGQPCIKGTRIPAQIFKGYARAGYDVAGMIAEFPTLTPEQIADALCWSLRPAKERERLTRATLHTDEGDEA